MRKESFRLLSALLCGLLLGIGATLLILALFPERSFASQCPQSIEPLFSPDSEDEILSLINSAERTLDIEMYTFSNQQIRDALIDAHRRGVKVRVILESRIGGDANEKTFSYLSGNGIEVRWASLKFKRTHSKMMIIDGKKVLVGSINFSKSALTSNREAAAVITGDVVKEYEKIFAADWAEGIAG